MFLLLLCVLLFYFEVVVTYMEYMFVCLWACLDRF